MRRHLRYLLAALVFGASAAGPVSSAVAQAPPAYQSSDPAKDEMMDAPPSEVTVTFDQPLDQSSWLKVLDECGKQVSSGASTVELNELRVGIGSRTPSGMYTVVYKAVGLAGATGTSGSKFEFMVHDGSPCKGAKKKHHHDPEKKKDHDHDDPGKPGHDGHDDTGDTGHDDHSGMTGTMGSDHGGHTMNGGNASGAGNHGAHGTGHGRHGGNHGKPPATGGGVTPPLASGDGGAPAGADGQAVLLGLGLALGVGVLGGWLLRMSTPSPAARPARGA
ncbi:MAG TPA: copper resistance protein CopC [Actinomycetota bacterium]|nr:copper resistance protein CopC [Actinomycetota bacterium]